MRRISRFSIAIFLVLILVTACSGGATESTPTPIPTPVIPVKPTYTVERGEVSNAVEFIGRVSPVVEEELFFRAGGYVGTVYVKRNDEVKAGDLLAELEVADLKNQILQVETSLENAISTNEQRIIEAKAALNKTELTLAIVETNDPAPQVQIAEVALERAQKNLEDTKIRTSNEDVIREAELNLIVAEAQYQQTLQAVDQHNYTIEINQQEVDLAKMRLEQLEKGLDIEEIQLSLDRLNNLLDDARLYAPFDGKIMSTNILEGRPAEAYKSVMVIADTSQLEISADLVSAEINQLLEEGMQVNCSLYDRPGEEFMGQIRQLPYPYGGGGKTDTDAQNSDQSTHVSTDESMSDLGLKLGDMVRIKVVLQYSENALWLPPQAIRTFDNRKFVVIQDGDVQRRIDVTLGITGQERVEIVQGLEEGQIVIGR